jgi:hypothetical protein
MVLRYKFTSVHGATGDLGCVGMHCAAGNREIALNCVVVGIELSHTAIYNRNATKSSNVETSSSS